MSISVYAITCIVVWVIVAALSPVEAVNIPICESRRQEMRKRSLLILSVSLIISTTLYMADRKLYVYILLATVWISIVLIAGKIKLFYRRKI